MKIQHIVAREILDSRGDPTLEVTVMLANGKQGRASVPSGASTGAYEAYELRDGDMRRYGGKGVRKAIGHVNQKIYQALVGKDVRAQKELDDIMIALDGTPQKKYLGANAILGVSLACAKAAAVAKKLSLYRYLRVVFGEQSQKYSLPTPLFNILNGGKHADTDFDIQEMMVIPLGIKRCHEQIRAGFEIFHALKSVLHAHHFHAGLGDEGGYAVQPASVEEAFTMILEAVHSAGYQAGKQIFLGLDMAASTMYDNRKCRYKFQQGALSLSSDDLDARLAGWAKNFPLLFFEDPFDQDDWQAWSLFYGKWGEKLMVVGDDLFATQTKRVQRGITEHAANALIIKPNQCGTLSETLDCVRVAKKHGLKIVLSHRSGETVDDFLADLAVAVSADFVKMGSSRGERVAKYNRLMEIEDELLHKNAY